MSYFDDVYCGLCKDILENGVQVHNRTGIDTIKVPSAHFHLDLSKEFPILTTKRYLSSSCYRNALDLSCSK